MSRLKRSPLKPGRPLLTARPLQTNRPPRRVGTRKRREIAATRDTRQEYLNDHPWCEIGYAMSMSRDPVIRTAFRSTCRGSATCVHERVKRSAQGSLTDPANLMSSCGPCNTWVEDNPGLAKAIGVALWSNQDPHSIPVERIAQDEQRLPGLF